MEAVETQNINALYESIASDPYILDKADGIPFANTPLHEAASNGNTRLAIEIRNLKPSLSVKLNQDGLSPLHLAVSNGHIETIRGLIRLDKDLIRVKGREMLTPLHYATETDDRVDILAELLLACPESVMDLNAQGETALHIATKKCNVKALKVLMGWIRKTGKHRVIYIPDARCNTILHTAVSTSQAHIVESVARGSSKYYRVHVNDENLEGATAADIAARLAPGPTRTAIESILRHGGASKSPSPANEYTFIDYMISQETWAENMLRILYFWRQALSMEMRTTVIVVAALIATEAFQVLLTPQGNPGYHSYLSGNGSYIKANISQINANISTSASEPKLGILDYFFYGSNTIAFICSITMIILVLPSEVFAPLHSSLAFMTITYFIAFPIGDLTIPVWLLIIMTCSLLLVASLVLAHIEYTFTVVGKIFCMSKRLEMLYRVLRN